MKVTALPELAVRPRGEVGPRNVAIGTFDGVHLGHREVIRGSDTVLTFDPHPVAVTHPDALPKLLTNFAIKRDLIAGLGVQELVVIPFDSEFAARSAERFVQDVLIGQLGAERVSVGENFRFGQKATGTPELLASRDEFETHVVPMVEVAGESVSSTQIRGLVSAGEVDQAARFLGGPFLLEGEVVSGDRRGRELGVPTANIVPDDELVVPGHGVYAAWVTANPGHSAEPSAWQRPAAVNVGIRPTFETGRGLLVEAHLIDFEGDLYGQTLRVGFVERMRGERRFDGVEALVDQMWRDVDQAREICRSSAGAQAGR
ncbi:MAG: bifunctional riboflavin kinase/FAD synthetase [Actinomycetota bacterium]|nr:bifunctional riboflavin kinase/FAD synthetase [Actinomycetota bacterium]MDQ3647732.1 bifunctional riboflavin kinase/FAD synthetase [Actinomycetota bacterium]